MQLLHEIPRVALQDRIGRLRLAEAQRWLSGLALAQLGQTSALPIVRFRHLRAVLAIAAEVTAGGFDIARLFLDDPQVAVPLAELWLDRHRCSYVVDCRFAIALFVERPAKVSLGKVRGGI